MSTENDDDLEVYIYQGKKGEQVPETVEKLIVDQGVQILPKRLCYNFRRLKKVFLADGLKTIDDEAFGSCKELLELKICNTLQHIGDAAFCFCSSLTKVDFETSTSSSPSDLRFIGQQAFSYCSSLQRIKLPSSVNHVGEYAFEECTSLVEANLSTTRITEIYDGTFAGCSALQALSLPNTLERIRRYEFFGCEELVTVIVPLDTKPIEIEGLSFWDCEQLANLVLPQDSTARGKPFNIACRLLHERYGEDRSLIVAGLVGRFENHAIHRLCYDHSTVTVQELRKCIADDQQEEEGSFVDEFGMTPFHVFFSTIEPNIELLDILLESLPNQTLLKLKDSNEKRPLDYLMNSWTDGTSSLVRRTLQKWMIDRLVRWGATSWIEDIQTKIQGLLAEDDDEERANLYDELSSAFEYYEDVEATSILEMALWKKKLKSGQTSDDTKQQAVDREACRCLSGSDVVIPHVAMFFLGIPRPSHDRNSE